MKSASSISTNGFPWADGCEIALKEMSMPPATAATASACSSTARASSASTTAVSAAPPAARMSPATSSSDDRVRPARKTLAPSPAKARATAPPMEPAAP